MLSLPRELSLSADDRLQMRPAKEVESLRGAWFPRPVSTLNNQQTTMVDNCEAMEVNLRWDCARSSAEQYGLRFWRWPAHLRRMPNSSVWCWSGIIRSMACAGRAACR